VLLVILAERVVDAAVALTLYPVPGYLRRFLLSGLRVWAWHQSVLVAQ